MKKKKISMRELVEKNKRELMKDKVLNEKIEKRVEEKYLKLNINKAT
jgi:hypothetical protein